MGNCKFNAQHHNSVINSDLHQKISISNRSTADGKVPGAPGNRQYLKTGEW